MVPVLRMLRPVQWSKNAVVLAGVIFSGEADQPSQLARAFLAVVAFCAASSAMYIVNDWHDRARDRLHPVKRQRPIASGAIGRRAAGATATALFALALTISVGLSWSFTACIVAYLALTTSYTYSLKNYAGIDVVAIASGFLLRAMGGALAVNVPMSPWLFLCTFLLALFLGFGKRRHELLLFNGAGGLHRDALSGYSRRQLDWAVVLTAIASVIAYSIYTLVTNSAPTDNALVLTVPFVALAIGRYLVLVFRCGLGGAPEMLLLKDRPLKVSILAWGVATLIVLNLP
jgi:4-hydroxybenzoate polyprenyltransferase